MSKKTLLISIFILIAIYSFSQTTTTPISKNFSIDGQYYNGNIKGLSLYMKALETDDNDLYKVLEPEMVRLKKKRNLAIGLGIAAYPVGLGTMAYGLGRLITSPNFDKGVGAIVAGPIIIVGSLIAAFVIMPNRQDYLNFINFSYHIFIGWFFDNKKSCCCRRVLSKKLF